jgi:hypothetical protein
MGLWQEDGELWACNWDAYGYQIMDTACIMDSLITTESCGSRA